VRDVEDAWFFMHSLFELIWQYRFLYRDLNDLLSKNRRLETHVQTMLKNKTRSIRAMLDGMSRSGAIRIDARDAEGHGHQHGGGADLLAELRVCARPAQGTRARRAHRRRCCAAPTMCSTCWCPIWSRASASTC
jgi:hypothetical protein